MKHLDVVDGVLASVPIAERPVPTIIGRDLLLVIMKLCLPDAEVWAAYTAAPSVSRLDCSHIQDYILVSNGLAHSTPCELSLTEEALSSVSDSLLDQLQEEGIGFTDMSIIHLATATIRRSYTELHQFRLVV